MKSIVNSVHRRNRLLGTFAFVILCSLAFSQIPADLRGGIQADASTIKKASEMKRQGWKYIMPSPKSGQAHWGNRDGRTTWYVGYWSNTKTRDSSSDEPTLKSGKYIGDGSGGPAWRKGGSPPPPSTLEWLLSASGGIKPNQ